MKIAIFFSILEINNRLVKIDTSPLYFMPIE